MRIHDRFRSGDQLFQLVIINTYLILSPYSAQKRFQFHLLVKRLAARMLRIIRKSAAKFRQNYISSF